MPKPPIIKPREVCRLPESHGFTVARQRGSHIQYRHLDGRGTTVPNHQNRDISAPLLRQIAKDIGMTLDDFLK